MSPPPPPPPPSLSAPALAGPSRLAPLPRPGTEGPARAATPRAAVSPGPSPDWTSLHAPVRALLAGEPFLGRAAIERARVHAPRLGLGVVACVPARNEADRLPRALEALAASLDRLGEPAGILVLVNNTRDGSADAAWDWARRGGHAVAVVEARLAAGIANAGHARRLALDLGHLVARPDAVLLTTDADTRVARDWASRLVGHVRAGAGAAAGMIDVEPREFAALPRSVHEVERAERALFREHARTWRLIVPDDPPALALRVGGASLAVSAAAYGRVGGMPALATCEDRAMVARMIEHDEGVAFDDRALIHTSCRLDGRADGGMAGMLRRRVTEPDPCCDEALHEASGFALRCLAWRALRGTVDAPTRRRIAGRLGCDPHLLEPGPSHGRRWTALLGALPVRPPLLASEVRREIGRARALRRALAAEGPMAGAEGGRAVVEAVLRYLGPGEGAGASGRPGACDEREVVHA